MSFVALTHSYGGVPTDRQAVIGAIIFLSTYLMPLVVMALVLHRLPRRWRAGIDISLATVFTFLALATPGGILAEGMALFFAVISIGASIDLLHLGGVPRGIVAWAISHWTNLSFWSAFAIVAVAMLINGAIAEAEDNAPSGFNNPLPPTESKPPAPTTDDTDRNG